MTNYNFKNRKIVNTYEDFIDEMVVFLMKNNFSSVVVAKADVEEIVDLITDEYMNASLNQTIVSGEYIYAITKMEEDDEVEIIVEPLTSNDKYFIHEADYILIDSDIFEDEMSDKFDAEYDGLQFIELDYNENDIEENPCEYCTVCNGDCEDEEKVNLEDVLEQIIKDTLDTYCVCPDCIEETLMEICKEAFTFGFNMGLEIDANEFNEE